MAVQTKRYMSLSHASGLSLEVFMEYEDTDFRVTNDDGDPDDFRVIRWFGTNHSSRDWTISVQRGNGFNWIDSVIPAGAVFSQNAGGPVQYEFDVPSWTYS